jgi:hypothetical protein
VAAGMGVSSASYFYVTIATVPVKIDLRNGQYISMTARVNNSSGGSFSYPTYVDRNSASMQITKVIAYDEALEQTD